MPRKILIIDDDKGDQKLMQDALVRAGLEVDIMVAETGEEGIKKTDELKPNGIVILDTVLPRIDGFATCEEIKKNGDENVKVIICTGVIDAVDAKKARAAGADDYCVKTEDYEALISVVKRFL